MTSDPNMLTQWNEVMASPFDNYIFNVCADLSDLQFTNMVSASITDESVHFEGLTRSDVLGPEFSSQNSYYYSRNDLDGNYSTIQQAQQETLVTNSKKKVNTLKKKTKIKRVSFTEYQLRELNKQFNKTTYPNSDAIEHLSELLNLSFHTVTVWFQNKRARTKRIAKQPAYIEAV